MSDVFGSLSGFDNGSLPEGYGEVKPENIQRMEAPEYGGIKDWRIFGGEGRSSSSDSSSSDSSSEEASSSEPDDKGVFWANLVSGLSDVSGSSAGSSSPDSGPGYCVRSGKVDKFTYHQYPDGSVKIAAGPTGHPDIGKTLSAGSSGAKNVEKWYGPCNVTTSGAPVASTTAASSSRGAAVGAGIGAAAAQLLPTLAAMLGPQDITPYDDEFEDVGVVASGGPNWGLIVGGVAVIGILGVGITMMVRNKDEEE
ncbi:hypothetical protein CMI37_16605 [Candidatus Pacearchaeota archaeon]|nr:hypothetical protein [Candidatus Pacearchaeota archaeon]